MSGCVLALYEVDNSLLHYNKIFSTFFFSVSFYRKQKNVEENLIISFWEARQMKSKNKIIKEKKPRNPVKVADQVKYLKVIL